MGFTNPLHIAILLLIVLLVFGARRLPELGRSLGSGIKEFKGSIEGAHSEPDQDNPTLTPPQAPPTIKPPHNTPATHETAPTKPIATS